MFFPISIVLIICFLFLESTHYPESETVGQSSPCHGDDSPAAKRHRSDFGRRKAPVWKHFEFKKVKGIFIAKCNYCKSEYKADSNMGTSNANRHIKKCDAYKEFVRNDPEHAITNVVFFFY